MTSSLERTPPMSANGCQSRVSSFLRASIALDRRGGHWAKSKPPVGGCDFARLASVRPKREGSRQMTDTGHELDVRLRGLRKSYGDVVALSGVDLDIARGEFFTLLGPSGSGKTTTLRLIAGFEQPADGTGGLAGRRGRAHRPRRGAAPAVRARSEHRVSGLRVVPPHDRPRERGIRAEDQEG